MIYILLGLPRSGKSTIVNKLIGKSLYSNYSQIFNHYGLPEQYKILNQKDSFNVICADDIRLALTGQRFYAPAEPMVHSIKHTMIKASLLRGHPVLIDETHSSDRSIKELLDLTPNVYGYFMNTSPSECERRAIECGQNDLVDLGVIRRMTEGFRNMNPKYKTMFGIKAEWI